MPRPPNLRYLPLCLLLLTVAVTLTGCTIQLVADHDQETEDEIVRLAREVDLFWGQLLDTPEPERPYEAFRADYNRLESDLRALVLQNEIRPLNEASTQQARTALALWQEDREHHRAEDGFSDFLARRHRHQFERIFRAMALGESVKDGTGEAEGQ